MIAYLQQHQGYVWQLTLLHLALCGEALGIALLIALPLGILISRYHALYVPIIGSFGAIYTIPSLALFALLVPQFGLTQVTALIALVVLVMIVLVGQFEGNVLHPMIMSRAVSLHPVVVALSVACGAILGGIVGAIVAVPLVSTVWGVVKYLRDTDPEQRPTPVTIRR